jgi:hypothetical protein
MVLRCAAVLSRHFATLASTTIPMPQVDADIRKILLEDSAPPPIVLGCRLWQKAIPQYNKGHNALLAELESGLEAAPGLLLAGNFRTGVAFGDCVQYGYEEAQKIAAYLGKGPPPAGASVAAPKASATAAVAPKAAGVAKGTAGKAPVAAGAAKGKTLTKA